MSTAIPLLRNWLERSVSTDRVAWLNEAAEKTAHGDRQAFYLGFGLIPRKLGKSIFPLTANELELANSTRPNWNPMGWSIDQLARTYLLLHLPSEPIDSYLQTLNQTFAAGEVGELVALYQSLCLLPHADQHRLRAAEGIRTNMKSVFAAVSQRNPYPAEQLEEGPWNQMVLKCLFVGLPLDPIVGLDSRNNPALAKMLLDYAHERWAAKRVVSPELWRPIGPFADDRAVAAFTRLLQSESTLDQRAAILALRSHADPTVQKLADTISPPGELTWTSISQDWLVSQRS